MEIRYVLMDPTGNITALVESSVPVEQQTEVAAQVMAQEPTCEQVAFAMPPRFGCDAVMRMAGGEFCGNASMCAAALHYAQLGENVKKTLRISVSDTVVTVDTLPIENGYSCCVEMPRPTAIETVDLDGISLPVVHFTGISHGIVTSGMEKDVAEFYVRRLCEMLRVEAAGLLLLDAAAEQMTPLVYVSGIQTLFWEGACGSGTSAVGAYLAHSTQKEVSLSLHQPGGTLSVEAFPDGRIRLKGSVRELCRGIVR